MAFLSKNSDGKKMVDKVFKAALKAKEAKQQYGDDQVVDATLGTLFDEDGKFVAFDSVWSPYDKMEHIQKAKYAASIQGNPNYRQAVYEWLFETENVPAEIIVTPGGAGAVSSTIKNVLDPGQILIKPSLSWGPYTTMAHEFDCKLTSYTLFKNGQFNIDSFKNTCNEVMEKQGKVLAIINDPCHNPSGYTMTPTEWNDIIHFINECSKKGPFVLLHDIAYVDFSTNPTWKKQLLDYQKLSDNAMVVIAFSLSKTFTAYGARVGAAVAITYNDEERNKFRDAEIYSARSIWSTCNNSVMELFYEITSNESLKKSYLDEKQSYIELIKERAAIFVTEATQVGLEIYPYSEGFFATIIVDDARKEEYNLKLQEHNIFTVEVAGGLRVALCSVSKRKLKGLAARIKAIIG
jgi:aspartate aminotransferase/aromatic-amino-acid transaminase